MSLEIHQSFLSEASLLNMLLACSALESLHFHDCRDTFITGKLFSNPLVLSHVRQAVPKLREICLADNCSYLSDALIDRFMTLVSGSPLRSLILAGTSVSFHPGIIKKYYPEANVDENGLSKSSELVLTFDCILGHIGKHAGTVKNLDFSRTPLNDKACLALSQLEDLKLSSLLLNGCEVSNTGLTSLCTSQSSLVQLDVSSCARITDTTLSFISTGLPHLQTLVSYSTTFHSKKNKRNIQTSFVVVVFTELPSHYGHGDRLFGPVKPIKRCQPAGIREDHVARA